MLTIRENQKLDNPPIIEALLQFRFATRLETSDSQLKQLIKIFPDMGNTETIQQISVNSSLQSNETRTENKLFAYRLKSDDEKRALVIGKGIFTLSYLNHSYSDWVPFIKEFRNKWALLTREIEVDSIFRLGVRFINKIPFFDLKTLDSLFQIDIPKMPGFAKEAGNIDELLFRIVQPVLDSDTRAMLSIVSDSQVHGGRPSFLYDLDIFSKQSYKSDSEDLWQKINEVRKVKNDIFFNSFTDRGLKVLNESI